METAAERGEIPRVSARLSLSVKDERADTGRDGRTYLARPDYQGRTGTRQKKFSLSS